VAGKVLNSAGTGTDSEVICGIDHAVALAADGVPTIVNFSPVKPVPRTGSA
jgi:hypothetical protein